MIRFNRSLQKLERLYINDVRGRLLLQPLKPPTLKKIFKSPTNIGKLGFMSRLKYRLVSAVRNYNFMLGSKGSTFYRWRLKDRRRFVFRITEIDRIKPYKLPNHFLYNKQIKVMFHMFYGFLTKKYLQKLAQKAHQYSKKKGWIEGYPKHNVKNNELFSGNSAFLRNKASNFFAYLLESRLDVIAFRLFFAPNILTARMMVKCGFITVNNVRIFSDRYHVKDWDIVSVIDSYKDIILERMYNMILNYRNLSVRSRKTKFTFLINKTTSVKLKRRFLFRLNFFRSKYIKMFSLINVFNVFKTLIYFIKRKLKYLKKLYISILFGLFYRKLRRISFKKIIRKRLLKFPLYFSVSIPLLKAIFHKDLIKLEYVPLPSKISLGHMLGHLGH